MAVYGRAGPTDDRFDTRSLGAVVALKPPDVAKSRLNLPDALRRRLARSMALDTITALSAVAARLVLVSDDRDLEDALSAAGVVADVLPEPRPGGMNPALEAGAESLRQSGCATVLACVGDLPALKPASVRAFVRATQDHRHGAGHHFLADASGIGTTMLLATRSRLNPRFGGDSAATHRSCGAVAVRDADLASPIPDARTDVDDVFDLDAVHRLGLGPATAAVVDSSTLLDHRGGHLAG